MSLFSVFGIHIILIDDVCIGVKNKLLVLVLVLMVDISVKAGI